MQEGREQGMQEGMAQILRGQLRVRFGPLPEWAKEKVNQASAEALSDWSLRLLDATSLADLLKER